MHNPKNILFIKLGEEGGYEEDCIKTNNSIRLGYQEINHNMCINGLWDEVHKEIQNAYKTNQGATTSHRNQIRKFYEEPTSTMWITFYDNKMWYCYTDTTIEYSSDGNKYRKTIDGWKDSDINGKKLFTQDLSGRLTKVQGFRGTICDIKEKEYLLHKINGTESPELIKVEHNLSALKQSLKKLLQRLNPQDFEILIDLIFRSAGWSRIGVVGKTTKTIDIELIAPVTNERAIIQIKSQSDLKEFNAYKSKFSNMTEYDKYFFIVHSPTKDLKDYINSKAEESVIIYDDEKLTELCINAGLIEWLITIAG